MGQAVGKQKCHSPMEEEFSNIQQNYTCHLRSHFQKFVQGKHWQKY